MFALAGCGATKRNRVSQDSYYLSSNYNDILRQGDSAVPELLDKLNSDDQQTRFWAMTLLGDIGSTKATPALLAIAQDPSQKNRNNAIQALGKIQDPAALPSLIKMSQMELSGDTQYSKLFSIETALVNYRDPAVIPELEKWLEKDVNQDGGFFGNWSLGNLVVRLAEAGDKKELPIFEKLFDQGHTMEPEFSAMVAIRKIDPGNPRAPKFGPILLAEMKKLSSNQSDQQEELPAIIAAGYMGEKSCVPAIIALDESGTVPTFQCSRALGRIRDPRAVPHLLSVMHGPLNSVGDKEFAIRALGEIGDPSALKDLERGFRNGRDRNYRAACAVACARIMGATPSQEVQSALTDAIVDTDWQPRMEIAEGLQGLPGKVYETDLAALQKDPEEAVRRAATGQYVDPYQLY